MESAALRPRATTKAIVEPNQTEKNKEGEREEERGKRGRMGRGEERGREEVEQVSPPPELGHRKPGTGGGRGGREMKMVRG